jgi:N-acyl-L-homoserine lactone synthetase
LRRRACRKATTSTSFLLLHRHHARGGAASSADDAILGAALFEYSLAHGIETIICVTDAFLIPTMQSLHWRPRPLGLPSKYTEGTAVGAAIEIFGRYADRLRATHGTTEPLTSR